MLWVSEVKQGGQADGTCLPYVNNKQMSSLFTWEELH